MNRGHGRLMQAVLDASAKGCTMTGQSVRQIGAIMLSVALPACVNEHRSRPDSVSAPVAIEAGQHRGIIECEEDHPCVRPPGSATDRNAVDNQPVPVSATDRRSEESNDAIVPTRPVPVL